MTPDEKLGRIDHVVVLMMENRSFDHMLGYLTRDGLPAVRGLEGNEFNLDHEGIAHPVHLFDAGANTVQRPGEALQKRLDPSHSKDGVRNQIGTAMDGFVRDYLDSRKASDWESDEAFDRDLAKVPMGYYTRESLPTYDYLARAYCVCDAWHSSVPGDTWPNRMYALAGCAGEQVWKKSGLYRLLTGKPSPLAKLRSVPVFDVPAFTRWLADDAWRWYSHDPATLRAADGDYRDFDNLRPGNFAWFDRKQMHIRTLLAEEGVLEIVAPDSFSTTRSMESCARSRG
jgi:phospholipase C